MRESCAAIGELRERQLPFTVDTDLRGHVARMMQRIGKRQHAYQKVFRACGRNRCSSHRVDCRDDSGQRRTRNEDRSTRGQAFAALTDRSSCS